MSLAAPVGAADTTGTLAILNGVPGQAVDVCVNGTEIKSKLPYGKAVFRDSVSTTEKILDFYKPDPRTCKGQRIAHHDGIIISAGDDLTIVVTKRSLKIVIFDNTGLGEIPPQGPPLGVGTLTFRHAADFATNFRLSYEIPFIKDAPVGPTADPVWSKGEQLSTGTGPGYAWELRVTRPESHRTIASRTLRRTRSEHRYELILVGSRPGNARLVLLDRKISGPSA